MDRTFQSPKKPPLSNASFLQENTRFQLGQMITHAEFGSGVILSIAGSGRDERVQIRFKTVGTKWLLAEYIHNAETC
jgi:hypothetical protein